MTEDKDMAVRPRKRPPGMGRGQQSASGPGPAQAEPAAATSTGKPDLKGARSGALYNFRLLPPLRDHLDRLAADPELNTDRAEIINALVFNATDRDDLEELLQSYRRAKLGL